MPQPSYYLAIDQGTTSTRAVAYDFDFMPVARAVREVRSAFPQPGWVEQDPDALLGGVVEAVAEVLDAVGGSRAIASVGLDNQGETTIAWDAVSGAALAPAIVWQCKRSTEIVDRLRATGIEPEIRALTGLPLDPYFSAGKMAWLIERDPAVQAAAKRGTLRPGTVDAWLTARLGDRGSLTDPSTASRTQLVRLASLDWDPRLLGWFGIDRATLPEIVPTAGDAGRLGHASWGGPLPLTALICDQQASLAGHGAFRAGAMKATYGTGVFTLANAGAIMPPPSSLEVSVAWLLPGEPAAFVMQGGVLAAGALLDWLRDGLGLPDARETDGLARSVADTGGVSMLPALSGLGAPWWRPGARAVFTGITTGTSRGHLARACLDGIAHLVADVVEEMIVHLPRAPEVLTVDGGLVANTYLMQRQADLLGMTIEIAPSEESTALGSAALAAIGAGRATPWGFAQERAAGRRVVPGLDASQRASERSAWRRFVDCTACV